VASDSNPPQNGADSDANPPGSARVDPVVFGVSAAISAAFVLWGVLDPDSVATVADDVLTWIIATFGWVFVISTAAFLVFAAVLAFSRFGRLRLGRDDDRPEFRTVSWIAMMFSAGMGIGLMFFAVAEPITHLTAPPAGTARAGSEAAAQQAMSLSYFHWALHPWAIYAIVGLALAYFTFRRGLPNLISSAFYPLLGDRIHGPIGKSIDILAIFATLFGSATSLGLGALQINSGLDFLWGVEPANGIAVAIIAVLTLAFVLSAVSGVHRGIQWLSNVNMLLAIGLLVFLLVVGPTVFQFETLVESIGGYLTTIVPASFRTGAFGDEEWLSAWTIFYWAWWISWAPFVGTFIARISKGRTIREFVVGVLVIPSGVSFVWFAVFGGAAIDLQLSGAADLGEIVGTPEVALFTTLEEFPLSGITSFVVIVLVALFFISGADAASLVMGMLSSYGSLTPRRAVTVVWGVSTGAAAAILLLADGLAALQQAAIIAAAPFTVVMIGLCVSLFKGLAADIAPVLRPEPTDVAPTPASHQQVSVPPTVAGGS
jgi:glycine betaine transporter